MWISIFRKLFIFSLLVISIFSVGHLWYLAKDGFNVNRLQCSLPVAEADDDESFVGVETILNRTYHYIGRGRQCYAFASDDGEYVLKMPRFDRYDLPFFWRAMPQSFMKSHREQLYAGRQERLIFTLESLRLAATDLREETSVVYLHLHRTRSLPEQFVMYDRLGRRVTLDLNRTAFVLQEKKEIMMPLCIRALQQHDRATTEKMLLSFLDIIDRRAQKGIFNRDPSFLKNFGWDGEKSIQIDIGSFWRRPDLSGKEAYLASLQDGTGPFRQWLVQTDPEIAQWFERRFQEKVAQVKSGVSCESSTQSY